MLELLKRIGHGLGASVQRALLSLVKGWRKLRRRGGGRVLMSFFGKREERAELPAADTFLSRWGLPAGEIYDNDDSIVVRLEVPGMDGRDIEVTVDNGLLIIRGEKRREREGYRGRYYLAECAYGWFERTLPLPDNVDTSGARASYCNGVLTVRLPKMMSARRSSCTEAKLRHQACHVYRCRG